MKARIFSNSCLQGSYFKLIFLPSVKVNITPGQFIMMRTYNSGSLSDPLLSRPFSIHRLAVDGSIEVLYKVVGKGTSLLSCLRKGDYIEFLGPLGNGFPMNNLTVSGEVIIVSGGIGIAPMVSLIETIKTTNPGQTIKVFSGGRNKEDLLCTDELEKMATEVVLTTNDGSAGVKGYVTNALHQYLSSPRTPHPAFESSRITVYSCGPAPMLKKIIELTSPLGIETYVSLESAMACGIGLCMGCVVKRRDEGYLLVCKDGPVFRGEQIELGS